MTKPKKHYLSETHLSKQLAIGLVSSETEFQISLLLNITLRIKLTLSEPIVKEIKTKQICFPCFKYFFDDLPGVVLVKNKTIQHVLLASHANFDYILIFSGDEAAKYSEKCLTLLKTNPQFSLIVPIATETLTNLTKLISAH